MIDIINNIDVNNLNLIYYSDIEFAKILNNYIKYSTILDFVTFEGGVCDIKNFVIPNGISYVTIFIDSNIFHTRSDITESSNYLKKIILENDLTIILYFTENQMRYEQSFITTCSKAFVLDNYKLKIIKHRSGDNKYIDLFDLIQSYRDIIIDKIIS